MHIVYLATIFIPSKKASSVHVMRMCQAFAENGHEVDLIYPVNTRKTPSTENPYTFYGVSQSFAMHPVRVAGSGRLADHMYAVKSVSLLRKLNPDLVYSRSITASYYLSFYNRQFIFESHQDYLHSFRLEHRIQIRRILQSKNLLRFVCISDALRKRYERKGNNPAFLVLHDGSDVFDLGEKTALQGRPGAMKIGYFGSLHEGRGIEIIMGIARQLPQTDLFIFGGEPAEINAWKNQADGIDNLYFYGFVAPQKVFMYRNSCDILLAPYQKTVFVSSKKAYSTADYMSPLKVFEYMASKKPIIASDLPVLREVLNEKNSILVSPVNVEEWVSAITTLMNDETLRSELSGASYSMLLDKYTWKKRAEMAVAFTGQPLSE